MLMELYMDKGDVVRLAATAASKTILKLFPPEATRLVFRQLVIILDTGKWKTKVGALDAIRSFVDRAKEEVSKELGDILPKVEHAMHDTKAEVRACLVISLYWKLTLLGGDGGQKVRYSLVFRRRKRRHRQARLSYCGVHVEPIVCARLHESPFIDHLRRGSHLASTCCPRAVVTPRTERSEYGSSTSYRSRHRQSSETRS